MIMKGNVWLHVSRLVTKPYTSGVLQSVAVFARCQIVKLYSLHFAQRGWIS